MKCLFPSFQASLKYCISSSLYSQYLDVTRKIVIIEKYEHKIKYYLLCDSLPQVVFRELKPLNSKSRNIHYIALINTNIKRSHCKTDKQAHTCYTCKTTHIYLTTIGDIRYYLEAHTQTGIILVSKFVASLIKIIIM